VQAPQPAFGAGSCPNEALRNGPSAKLPDCRAYELMSTQSGGKDAVGAGGLTAAGSPVSYGIIAFEGGPFSSNGGSWVAQRGASGWVATNMSIPGVELEGAGGPINGGLSYPAAYSEDGTRGVYITAHALDPNDTNEALDVYAGSPQGGFRWLTEQAIRGPLYSSESGMEYESSTGDLSTVVFEAHQQLLADAPAQLANGGTGREIYRWHQGRLELASVLPGETTGAPGGAAVGSAFAGEASLNAVSADGSEIFFESPDPTYSPENIPAQLYARLGGERTVEVSAPAPGINDPEGPQAATYVGATPDGSSVFFTSRGSLTADANTSLDSAEDLYRYDVATATLTDISAAGLASPEGSQVQGLVGASADGKTAYFVAKGVLAGQNRERAEPTAGADNLYVWNGATITYVATLNEEDGVRLGSGIWGLRDGTRPADTTSDGAHLALISLNKLTGYESNGSPELYVYDDAAETLTCASCNAAGPPTAGGVAYGSGGARINGTLRFMTEDGSEVFFASTEPLTPAAKGGAHNVYEYREGEQHLISSTQGAQFEGMSANGSDVYIGTPQPLVPAAGGEIREQYDARIDGGFPEEAPAAMRCRGAECQSPATPPPDAPAPASATFSGGENLAPASSAPRVTPAAGAATRARQLGRALAKCRRARGRKRVVCERRARRRYAPSGRSASAMRSAAVRGGS
jgi:hypothetical protein